MRYKNIREGRFVSRPNRLLPVWRIDGQEEICHVKKHWKVPGIVSSRCLCFLEKSDKKERKTAYDLIAVRKGDRLINMDSQIPNRVVEEWLRNGGLFGEGAYIRPETKYGTSRFDLYIEQGERKIFMEVKGVTLEEEGIVRFPDAPTERGIKHIKELCQCIKDGYEAYIMFVIQMKDVRYFEPNKKTQEAFARALLEAEKAGVHILAYDCFVEPDSIFLGEPVEVQLI